MSIAFTLSDNTSVISANFFPAIELDKNSRYGLGLLGFYSYNSIFNVDEGNNSIGYATPGSKNINYSKIKPGAYEIEEIRKSILWGIKGLKGGDEKLTEEEMTQFILKANNNTLKCELKSKYDIIFMEKNSLGSLLGFQKTVFKANRWHESTLPVNIMKVRMIRVDCNVTAGAYLNSKKSHTLFEFDLDVEPGYKLTKEPQNIIYLPVSPEGRQFIDNITLRILDDQGNLIDFQGEKIIIKLELKKLS